MNHRQPQCHPPAGKRGQLVFGQVCQLEMSPTPGAVVWVTPFSFVSLEWEAQDSFGTTWLFEVSNLCPYAQACFTDPRGPWDPHLLPLSFQKEAEGWLRAVALQSPGAFPWVRGACAVLQGGMAALPGPWMTCVDLCHPLETGPPDLRGKGPWGVGKEGSGLRQETQCRPQGPAVELLGSCRADHRLYLVRVPAMEVPRFH